MVVSYHGIKIPHATLSFFFPLLLDSCSCNMLMPLQSTQHTKFRSLRGAMERRKTWVSLFGSTLGPYSSSEVCLDFLVLALWDPKTLARLGSNNTAK